MAFSSHICVIGSLNIDFAVSTSRCPGPGETLTANSLSVAPGGKGANQAVACGRASLAAEGQQDVAVTMIGAVGSNDTYYSTLIRPMLKDSGVNTEHIEERTDSTTGSATIIVEEAAGGENRILVVPGANHTGMRDVQKILTTLQQMPQSPALVVLQGEIPKDTVVGLLEHFNKPDSTTHVLFNPAPVFPDGVPLSALIDTTVLVMNETEAAQMRASILGESSSDTLSADDLRPEELAAQFHEVAKVKIVLITLGAKGVFYSTITGKQGMVDGVRVQKVVDTTAAGDTFVGYFAAAFARFVSTSSLLAGFDDDIENAVQRANCAAAICVQGQGAMQSIPRMMDVDSLQSHQS
ncbi:ribokinase [Aspergillus clavatus NRRL 1]|uniref:Ribokinase n=1 Tax=Aspergillus clavatus (strain ATCC 1007 / CBS 513.65 / DSM 816 / NCTC 3887 / NRRL 1 / QM 1276 / 107) TaxID=344612 RepID=A1CN46_ASPCL|nr:ribokinase [Aspergillus clavatus NRRL 1]EAW08983.1 ribokinase [Aspergillus clavatus NRRL 1]